MSKAQPPLGACVPSFSHGGGKKKDTTSFPSALYIFWPRRLAIALGEVFTGRSDGDWDRRFASSVRSVREGASDGESEHLWYWRDRSNQAGSEGLPELRGKLGVISPGLVPWESLFFLVCVEGGGGWPHCILGIVVRELQGREESSFAEGALCTLGCVSGQDYWFYEPRRERRGMGWGRNQRIRIGALKHTLR